MPDPGPRLCSTRGARGDDRQTHTIHPLYDDSLQYGDSVRPQLNSAGLGAVLICFANKI